MIINQKGKKVAPKESEHTHDEHETESYVLSNNEAQEGNELKTIGLIGDVSEEASSQVIYSLLNLHNNLKDEEKKDRNFDFYISTFGGSAADMFAIYDVMRMVREKIDIQTIGIGKVMSAGVPLLAAGTKGKRKIGKHCRVMIHSVLGGNEGSFHNLENEMDEIRWNQERYINVLSSETKMTKTVLKKLLDKKVNIYLSAEEAVKYGIADRVV